LSAGLAFGSYSSLDSTQESVSCIVQRELLNGTLRVYWIRDICAIKKGERRFYGINNIEYQGFARFVIF
jgi:hypothetical protein